MSLHRLTDTLPPHAGNENIRLSIPALSSSVGTTYTGALNNDPGKTITAPYLLGIGHLINYVQERQDYIATVASGTCPYF